MSSCSFEVTIVILHAIFQVAKPAIRDALGIKKMLLIASSLAIAFQISRHFIKAKKSKRFQLRSAFHDVFFVRRKIQFLSPVTEAGW
jgi:hypothetical protein